MPKPLVDRLEGIAPAVAIEQRNPTSPAARRSAPQPRCTTTSGCSGPGWGAVTAARCGAPVRRDTPQTRPTTCWPRAAAGSRSCFPLPPVARLTHARWSRIFAPSASCGCMADGAPYHLDELPAGLDLTRAAELLGGGGPPERRPASAGRLAESVAAAFQEGEGIAVVLRRDGGRRLRFTRFPACSALRHARRHRHAGALLVQQSARRLRPLQRVRRGARVRRVTRRPRSRRAAWPRRIDPWTKPRYESRRRILLECARTLGADASKPWPSSRRRTGASCSTAGRGAIVGIFPFLKGLEEKRYKQYIRVFLRQYQLAKTCDACAGSRLNPDALAVRIGRDAIADVAVPFGGRHPPMDRGAGASRHGSARSPTSSWRSSRPGSTSSATWVLGTRRWTARPARSPAARPSASRSPTPSARDWWTRCTCSTSRPSASMRAIPTGCSRCSAACATPATRSSSSSTISAAIRQADFMLELGPGCGRVRRPSGPRRPSRHGAASLTGQYLTGQKRIAVPSARRPAGPRWLRIRGATLHNLRAWTPTSRSAP